MLQASAIGTAALLWLRRAGDVNAAARIRASGRRATVLRFAFYPPASGGKSPATARRPPARGRRCPSPRGNPRGGRHHRLRIAQPGCGGAFSARPVGDLGTFQLETTRLLPRPEPYHLHVELARQRLMRISMKREEWGLFDYSGMDEIAGRVDQARDCFVAALQQPDVPEQAARLADEALALAVGASEEMCRFHVRCSCCAGHSAGAFARGGFLGANAPSTPLKTSPKVKLADVFDFVRLPFVWRELQPKENTISYESVDALVKAYAKAGLAVRGGPVLSFGVQSVPDWMYLWENDEEALFDFARARPPQRARYAGSINNWIVATGLHADGVLGFKFEQIIELTRLAVTTVRQAAPKSQIVLDLAQPWGEYYARNQRTVPPLLYAEMAVQSGIRFDAYGLQFVYGVDSEGFHLRDMLQISSMIDRLASYGKPIHVTAIGARTTARPAERAVPAGPRHHRRIGS